LSRYSCAAGFTWFALMNKTTLSSVIIVKEKNTAHFVLYLREVLTDLWALTRIIIDIWTTKIEKPRYFIQHCDYNCFGFLLHFLSDFGNFINRRFALNPIKSNQNNFVNFYPPEYFSSRWKTVFSRLAGRSVQISSTRLLGIDTRLESSGPSSFVTDSASSTISHAIRPIQPERCITYGQISDWHRYRSCYLLAISVDETFSIVWYNAWKR